MTDLEKALIRQSTLSRIHKEVPKLNSYLKKKKKGGGSPIRKWAKGMNRPFTKEDKWMAKNTLKHVQHHHLLEK